ncbi:MAG: winged helix-turn-helix transcriptional regulator [Nevskiales bacterium]
MSRSAPRPGQAVRGSRSGRPIMVLLDLLGRRWTLRILWELRHGPLNFRELRAACGDMSPSVLNLRLQELREAGIVTVQDTGGYVLSESGRQLFAALAPLQVWADQWLAQSSRRPRA